MDTITKPDAELSIVVAAPAAKVWSTIADVTRIPEWSPVCHRVDWIGDSRDAAVGARFRGHNRLNGARWSRECVITEAEPGRLLSFSTLFKGEESTRWRYSLQPEDGGTRVSEAYEIVRMPRWVRFLRSMPGAAAKSERDTETNLGTSLERLKAIVEAV
ncbi:MAG: SRPBCC family protein [Actinomycetota bacterium]